jgi:hypothetical protein
MPCSNMLMSSAKDTGYFSEENGVVLKYQRAKKTPVLMQLQMLLDKHMYILSLPRASYCLIGRAISVPITGKGPGSGCMRVQSFAIVGRGTGHLDHL